MFIDISVHIYFPPKPSREIYIYDIAWQHELLINVADKRFERVKPKWRNAMFLKEWLCYFESDVQSSVFSRIWEILGNTILLQGGYGGNRYMEKWIGLYTMRDRGGQWTLVVLGEADHKRNFGNAELQTALKTVPQTVPQLVPQCPMQNCKWTLYLLIWNRKWIWDPKSANCIFGQYCCTLYCTKLLVLCRAWHLRLKGLAQEGEILW